MPIHRRDFMKLVGVSVASLYLARCHQRLSEVIKVTEEIPLTEVTCYTGVPEVYTPEPTVSEARDRVRLYWLRFEELAQSSLEDTENMLGNELITGHRVELDELVARGEISTPVADLVQESYDAAVYHVWRSNAPITCYEPVIVDYAPSGAAVLVEQSQVLSEIASTGTIDPTTLAKAQAALEHDLSFYALTDPEVDKLYGQLLQESQETGQSIPSFEALTLELTPEAKEATQFIVDLLTGK